jgi:hypothetical protein
MYRKPLIAVAAVIAGIAGWAAFRPELLFVNKSVNESFPPVAAAAASGAASAAAPRNLASGMFHSVAHQTKGDAGIYELPGGKRILRLTNFETSNGPDVRVYLVAAPDATDNATVKNAGFIEVGPLKGNEGDQNYDVPAEVDLNKYQAVTIWCRRFGVNFATAPLKAGEDKMETTAGGPIVLADGTFHSVAHQTMGKAAIYDLDGSKKILRLTNFETSNGPDVRVYLVAANDATDNATVKNAGFIELGALKGNKGDQNYDVPSDLDLGKYRAVTIWCHRFNVNFATAPLTPRKN